MRLSRMFRIVPFFLPAFSIAAPEAQPEAKANPEPLAEAEPQTYSNNAPFSGAIYIVNPNGQSVTTQSSNMCPSYASVSCGNMGQPSWCCPSGYTCVSPSNSNGIIGCCPAGSSCGGSVNVASVTTVTVYGSQQTSVVYVQASQTTTTAAPYHTVTQQAAGGAICSTLTMNGPGLPITTQGSCGTILIVNEAPKNIKAIGYGVGIFIVLVQLVIGRMFYVIQS